MTSHQKTPTLFLSLPHPCSYLPGKMATSLFLDPRQKLDTEAYAGFMRLGFRRSGDFIYRPHCGMCQACVPVRIPVARFKPSRSQRRVWRRNQDLEVRAHPAVFSSEHFSLYARYQASRHPGGGMDDPNPEKFLNFLVASQIDTVFHEFRLAGRLLAVAVVDFLSDSLSAVYTFYDPDEQARGLGVHAVLWQVEEARRRQLPYVYLGYWIGESPKMAYKANYAPLEAYLDNRWSAFNPVTPDTQR